MKNTSKHKRIALITGASGGIGASLVEVFDAAGYDVIATDNTYHHEWRRGQSRYVYGDLEQVVVDKNYAGTFFKEIHSLIGNRPIDVLINNAAVQILGGVKDIDREEWSKTLNINLIAPFLLTKEFYSKLAIRNGMVLNISSIHAQLTKKSFLAYSTSKAALSALTKAMAIDFGSKVRVNAIEPAAIDTKMLSEGFNNDAVALVKLKDCHPVGNIGSAKSLAKLALSIASLDTEFMTGSVISFNGAIGGRLHDI